MQRRARNADQSKSDLVEKVIHIGRVAKVVKGGRNFRFSALVVVGDENGNVGVGAGKAVEVPEAIRKGIENAKRSIVKVPMVGTTIPHESIGRFGAGKVILMPAKEGTGIIAGGPVRAILQCAGVKDIRAKSLGSDNPRNVVNATMDGIDKLKTVAQVAKLRGKTVEEILS